MPKRLVIRDCGINLENTGRCTIKPSAKQRIITSKKYSSPEKEDNKKAFYRYIKNLRRDSSGISPLKVEGRTISDPPGKAGALSD